jgi:hypothetical protein
MIYRALLLLSLHSLAPVLLFYHVSMHLNHRLDQLWLAERFGNPTVISLLLRLRSTGAAHATITSKQGADWI